MFRSLFCAMAITAFATMLSAAVGCGGGGGDQTTAQSDSHSTTSNEVTPSTPSAAPASSASAIPANHVLVGNWKGDLIATAEQLKEMNCQSVTLELEFGSTGEMAMLATMTNDQGRDESSGIATWAIAKEEGSKYTIQSQESENEIQELVVQMIDRDTMVVNAAEGGQFKLSRFTPVAAPPAPQPGSGQAPIARQAQLPSTGAIAPPPVSNALPPSPAGQVQPPPVQ